MLMAEKMAWFC